MLKVILGRRQDPERTSDLRDASISPLRIFVAGFALLFSGSCKSSKHSLMISCARSIEFSLLSGYRVAIVVRKVSSASASICASGE